MGLYYRRAPESDVHLSWYTGCQGPDSPALRFSECASYCLGVPSVGEVGLSSTTWSENKGEVAGRPACPMYCILLCGILDN